ncbi:hypothetical protein DFQ26_004479 [Actinomortierella ambigua]|nr:hypothetical protein DFQ26_004479 [Actinomortierella ambigua]
MATRITPPQPLTIDIAAATIQLKNGNIPPPPQTAALTGNGAASPCSPGFFHPKKQYQYHEHSFHHLQRAEARSPLAPSSAATELTYWASPPSTSTTLVTTFTSAPFGSTKDMELESSQSNEDDVPGDRKSAHGQGDGAFHMAIKVDSLYQQPHSPAMTSPKVFHPQQSAFPKQQAYIQKFNSYTTGSRLNRHGNMFIPLTPTTPTTPTTTLAALQAIENEKYQITADKLEGYQFPPATGAIGHGQYMPVDHHLHHHVDQIESPGSPMSMTCPPPYQGGGSVYALERSSSTEKLPLTPMTSSVARPKLARLSSTLSAVQAAASLPPMAIPISTEADSDSLHCMLQSEPTKVVRSHMHPARDIIGADDDGESLYNLRVSEDGDEVAEVKATEPSSHEANMRMGAMLPRYSRNRVVPFPSSNDGKAAGPVAGPMAMSSAMVGTVSARMASVHEPLQPVQFPSFWHDAQQHRMHWAPSYSLRLYRLRRAKFQRRQREECQRRQRATTILFSDRPRRHGPWLHDMGAAATADTSSSLGATTTALGGNGGDHPSPAYTARASSALTHQLHSASQRPSATARPSSFSSSASSPRSPRSPSSPSSPSLPQWPSMSPHAPMRQNQQFLTVDGHSSSSSSSSSLAMLHHQTPQTPPPAYCLKRIELPEMDLGDNLTLSFDVNRFSM